MPVATRSSRLDRCALSPSSEFVSIWFPSLVEGTNSQLTERTKKMNSENIKKITNQAIEQLITALNEGRSETLTQYLAAIGQFHRYSLRNVMLIASQKPTASHVAGFHAWHKLGRFVKKGEKGILILAPIVRRKNESPNKPKPTNYQRLSVFARPTSLTSARRRAKTFRQ
jgi:hypothetical protein